MDRPEDLLHPTTERQAHNTMAEQTNSRGGMRDDSPPRTPRTGFKRLQKGKTSMRALNTRPTQQETFFDDSTPVDNHRNGERDFDRSRDFHDLSFVDGTRDSVVDNMLLSLDQLPTGAPSFPSHAALYSNFDDDHFFTSANAQYAPPKPSRLRGHTYTSSYSSDYEPPPDDTSSRYSSHHSRGRRSNSSSNFQNGLNRIESLKGAFNSARISTDTQSKGVFGDPPVSAHARGGGKKGSKGSGSSSMDFGYSQVLGTHRLAFGNRSASFDHSYGDRTRASPAQGFSNTVLDRGRPQATAYNHYDAAPEPTVPVGPRRLQEPPATSPIYPQPNYAPPQAPVPQRKNSVRSSTGKTLRKGRSHTQESNMRSQANDFLNASNLRELLPIPAFVDPPAPSPTVALRKASIAPPTTLNTPKEKQGFFRRVFGTSKNHHPPQHHEASLAPPQLPPVDIYPVDDAPNRPKTIQGSSNHIASQLKYLPKPPPQTAPATAKELPPQLEPQPHQPPAPTLNKKHSSFFRRRKKSVSETARPPVMPLQLRPIRSDLMPAAQPSPSISSLRKVMNPYLSDLASPRETYYDSREYQPAGEDKTNGEHIGSFSPGYTPHKDATVRTVKPSSRGTDNSVSSSRGEAIKTSHSLNTDSPKLKLKMKRGRTNLANPHDDSFLADSSGNEDRSGGVTPSGKSPTFGLPDETRRPKTSPISPSFLQFPMRSKENETPQRKANIGEKRSELLSPHVLHIGKSSPSADVEDDGWVITTPIKEPSLLSASSRTNRVWLEPTSSEERLDEPKLLSLPLEGARTSQKVSPTTEQATPSSTSDIFQSATSLPIVQVDGGDIGESGVVDGSGKDRSSQDEEPTEEDRGRALKIFNGEEDLVTKAEAAGMLGDVSSISSRTRKAYMDLFDWSGLNILSAMRDLCGKLVLRAETQQVDRILMSFSERWCECNPNHGFKATDVVHTICYSVLLLNTDLHLADIESRMTRNQFVKNTLPTIRRVSAEAAPDVFDDTLRPQTTQARGGIPWSEPSSPAAESPTFPPEVSEERPSLETKRSRNRLSVRPPVRTGSDGLLTTPDSAHADNCNVLVKAPYEGSAKGWEFQVEIVLKDFYNSIRQQRLPLHGAVQTHDQPSTNGLSVSSMLRRTPSVLSKAPSDTTSYRGRSQTDFRSVAVRWNSKTRSRSRMYPTSTIGSSRTSLDDQSVWSPAGSSTWSKYSFGKTQTSMSMESLGSQFAHGDYQQSIGFANALSQAIIREEGMTITSSEEFSRVAPLLEDETLELAGAPWAKEGILKHKHHLESLDKKAKDRNWNECFAVIEKGYMRLFSFSINSKSLRQKNKSRPSAGSVVGGGNWMDNAEALGSFLLRQSIASALPPPGYSKSRPHVWALSLPTGAVHLFQVGTPDIVKEFVSTANYWSARLSKEPLVGGVSNIEYGWGENVINPALIRQDSAPSNSVSTTRPSMQSSIRSSVDHASGTVKARLPGDKVPLSEWCPPTQSMMASNLMEVDQLKALTAYVKNIEDELARHNELRAPMLIAFSPRHPNAAKAMANWERKSSYLLREIVKFRTYIDSLTTAQILKEKIYAEREAEATKNGIHGNENAAAESTAIDADGGITATRNSELISA